MQTIETTLRGAFLEKYPKYEIILRLYSEANGCECEWGNLSKLNLQRFVRLLKGRLSLNSVRQYCAKLKAVLNLYSEEIGIPTDYLRILSIRGEATQNVYLTDEEIERIINYRPRDDNERIARNQFVLGCLTCARHSDYKFFTMNNIKDGRLVYVSQKTKIQAVLPVSPALERFLIEQETYNLVGKSLTDPTFNDTIRRICRNVGITQRVKVYQAGEYTELEKWRYVSSHTARRSAITNLYLRGADLYLISKLSGHSSVTQTERYICCGLRDIPDNVLAYFSRFR